MSGATATTSTYFQRYTTPLAACDGPDRVAGCYLWHHVFPDSHRDCRLSADAVGAPNCDVWRPRE